MKKKNDQTLANTIQKYQETENYINEYGTIMEDYKEIALRAKQERRANEIKEYSKDM